MRNMWIAIACFSLVRFLNVTAEAGVEVTASKSLTVQPNGPRTGDAGSKYFNIEGKDNDQYASFGVLVFDMPKKIDASKINSVSLTLVQSVPRFAKDGEVKFYLAAELDPAAALKFDAKSDNNVGNQIKPLYELGSGTFKQVETGEMQSFTLKLDGTCRERIAKGGRLCLVVVPANSSVAATYFGAGESRRAVAPSSRWTYRREFCLSGSRVLSCERTWSLVGSGGPFVAVTAPIVSVLVPDLDEETARARK